MLEKTEVAIKNGNPETLKTWGTQDTERKRTKQKHETYNTDN